jgi:hypothetical protein
MRDTMMFDGKIGPEDLDLMLVTDDVDEAVRHIVTSDKSSEARRAPSPHTGPHPEPAG